MDPDVEGDPGYYPFIHVVYPYSYIQIPLGLMASPAPPWAVLGRPVRLCKSLSGHKRPDKAGLSISKSEFQKQSIATSTIRGISEPFKGL